MPSLVDTPGRPGRNGGGVNWGEKGDSGERLGREEGAETMVGM